MAEVAVTEKEYRNLIAGEWVASLGGETYEDRNPADTEELIGRFQSSTREDIQQAVKAAREALPLWAETPAPERGRILHRVAEVVEKQKEELATVLTREEGKTLAESRGEVQRAADIFRFFASLGYLNGETIHSADRDLLLFTFREPLGVVAVITPWNFPIAIPAWKIAPGLISGNTVVFKPAQLTPLIGIRLMEALAQSGIPKGVVNMVSGSGSVIGDELVASSDVDAISFTGSYEVGSRIAQKAAETLKRTQLEMGGKNPLVVLEDADLDKAVDMTARGAFGVTGQACTATSRAIIVRDILEPFVEKLVERAKGIRIGNGLDSEVQMGPAVNQEQLEKDLEYIQIGRDEGAEVAIGGHRMTDGHHAKGYFVEATVFTDVRAEMRIAQEEIFGPIVGIIEARDFDQAVEIANQTVYGLTACICTRDLERAHLFVRKTNAGVIKVNRPTVGLELQAPFGGMKHSSSETFKEQGKDAIQFYTRLKTAYLGYR
ncbi:aldehyde dehydrogenase family protein [Acidobacteria bacterium AH-259-L09]|nr:aldehyde dehydrogenase family protein [Acidobacteria bacterium AH-259-L09]